MRKILLSLFLAVITAATGFTQSLLYSFPFDGSLSATVGTGTFSGAGASYTTDRHGNANKALAKPLDNGYTAPLAVPSGTASRTIALWFKRVGGADNFPHLFSYGGSSSGQLFAMTFQSNGGLFISTPGMVLRRHSMLLYHRIHGFTL